jgi:hypothetical protein
MATDWGCRHKRTRTSGGIYEYCLDCGAVRRLPRAGDSFPDSWHVCDLCRLPRGEGQ